MVKNVYAVYFTGKGTTKKIIKSICENFSTDFSEINILDYQKSSVNFEEDDLVVFGMPVYSGRIPEICVEPLTNLEGNNAKAISIVSYGNREYEDALLELNTILEKNNFDVIGSGACVAEHSIFPQVATSRPDIEDLKSISEFSEKCKNKLDGNDFSKIEVPGNNPYREVGKIPIKPVGDKKCINCGLCVKNCPTGAIDISTPRITDKEKCISCGACIACCPVNARKYKGFMYYIANKTFKKNNSTRKEPEFFI